jgi:cation diffusion facilitator CzcD-associated flavoprotein CzcO
MCGGALSQPKLPEGIDLKAFQGIQFHSQNWKHDVSFGKKMTQNTLNH